VSGELRADGSVGFADPDESNAVYAKGFFGTVGPEGRLTLDRYESVYLAEMGRIEVHGPGGRGVPWPTVFRRAVRADRGFPVRYLVYRDLRQRGYIVREGPPPLAFAVLPRGGILHKTPSRYWVEALSERVPFDLARLFDLAEKAQAARRTLWLGLVDEESDLTYYRIRRPGPTGTVAARDLPTPTEGWLSHDRVTVHDPVAVEALGKDLAYGSRVGSRLELSLLEAAHLADAGQLRLRETTTGRPLLRSQLAVRARRLDPRFDERLAAYRELRGRRLVVKTGFKYGAHFRAYPRSPESSHARYLVHALPEDHRSSWPEVAGSIRVAQGVRKEYLLASVPHGPRPVRFLSLERIRP
jgi:tRNA-intron endonuclease, archaea type